MPYQRRDPRLHKKKGWYYLVFYNPLRRPQRKWVPLGTKQKRQAARDASHLTDEYRRGDYDPWTERRELQAVTVREAAARYLAWCRSEGIRAKPLRWKRDFLERFARSLPPGAAVATISARDVERFVFAPPAKNARHAKSRKRRAASTLKTYHAQLKTFFDWCVGEGLCDRNPAADARRPKAERLSVDYLTPDQLDRLLRAIEADHERKLTSGQLVGPSPERQIIWLADVLRFMACTALRPSEAVRLRWRDVDLDAPRIIVRHTEAGKVKTETGVRVVPLVTPAVEVLHRQHELRVSEDDASPVFLSPDVREGPRPLSPSTLSRSFRKYRRQAKLPEEVTLYNMRTTCGVLLASRGVPLRIIQKVLGHQDVRTTASTYTEAYDEAVRAEMERAMEGLRW